MDGSDGTSKPLWEADPCHAEIITAQYGLNKSGAKGLEAPGKKMIAFDENAVESSEAMHFRSSCMQALYLSRDRVDIQCAVNEIARFMAMHVGLRKR